VTALTRGVRTADLLTNQFFITEPAQLSSRLRQLHQRLGAPADRVDRHRPIRDQPPRRLPRAVEVSAFDPLVVAAPAEGAGDVVLGVVGDQLTPTRLAGNYGNSQEATVALEDILARFESHGFNAEHGYHWARDHEGNQFRFVISGR
jgi:hypothetical protein